MRIFLKHKHQHLPIDVLHEGGRYRVAVDGREHVVDAHFREDGTVVLAIDNQTYRVAVARSGRERLVAIAGEVYSFLPDSGVPSGHSVDSVASPEVIAPMPGKVLQVFVQPGDVVTSGDPLLILEAMKMENRLTADAAATVQEVRVTPGSMVDGGQVLVVLAYLPDGQ